MKGKRAIVLASFGTSEAAARGSTLDLLAKEVQEAYPSVSVRQAYTSNFVRRRMASEGISAPSVPECLEALAQEGCEEVVVQPTHLSPGEEYENKILSLRPEFQRRFARFSLGTPLFFHEENGSAREADFAVGLRTVMDCFPPETDEQLVLLGHGSPHRHNPIYEELQDVADRKGWPVHIGLVEDTDTPNFSMVERRLKEKKADLVLLAPLLLTGGIHVSEDLAGEGEHSWKRRLQGLGFSVRVCMKGLGTFPEFRGLYLEKLRKLMI